MSEPKRIPKQEVDKCKKLAQIEEFKVKFKTECDDINRRMLGVKEYTKTTVDKLLKEFEEIMTAL